MNDTNDVYQLVQVEASLGQFHEYLAARRKALIQQAKALEAQRTGVLMEVSFIEQVAGVKIKRASDSQ